MQLLLVAAGMAAALLMPVLAILGSAVMLAVVVVMARPVTCEYMPAYPHTLILHSI